MGEFDCIHVSSAFLARARPSGGKGKKLMESSTKHDKAEEEHDKAEEEDNKAEEEHDKAEEEACI